MERSAKEYTTYEKGENVGFERIRRITGYLVGSMDNWNNAKKAEEHDRVKHGVISASIEPVTTTATVEPVITTAPTTSAEDAA
ncbi:MAG: anaerobic ribonucleoside-triphosphate reductase [Rikenellaceae bacterium]